MVAEKSSAGVDTPMYSDRRRSGSSSGGMGFMIFLMLLLVLSVAGAGWLYFDQINKNANLRQDMIDLKQSIAIIREALQITDESITDQFQERGQQIKTLQEEVNKLWVLTNNKHKSQLRLLSSRSNANEKSVTQITETIDTMKQHFDDVQTSNQERFTTIETHLETIQKQIDQLPEFASVSRQIDDNVKALVSLNNTRAALNSRVAKMQQEISLLKSKILTLENNQPIPSYNLDNQQQNQPPR